LSYASDSTNQPLIEIVYLKKNIAYVKFFLNKI